MSVPSVLCTAELVHHRQLAVTVAVQCKAGGMVVAAPGTVTFVLILQHCPGSIHLQVYAESTGPDAWLHVSLLALCFAATCRNPITNRIPGYIRGPEDVKNA